LIYCQICQGGEAARAERAERLPNTNPQKGHKKKRLYGA